MTTGKEFADLAWMSRLVLRNFHISAKHMES